VHHLTWLGALAIFAAGWLAGMINAIVGSGSLITFPTLVALGYSPLVANVSNNVGLVFGNISGVYGYRRELVGQAPRIRALTPWSAAGGLLGAILLLIDHQAFKEIVPWLIVLAVIMVVLQPRLARALASRHGGAEHGGVLLRVGSFLTGVYGGYFGAAQGVILIAILAICIDDNWQRLNGYKNVAAGCVNLLAGILFVIFAPVNWTIAGIIAISSVLGAQVGAKVGRRLPPQVLRAVIVVGGLSVAIYLLR
jgi:uncharacterized membrane protein YfcA